jgi:hypothetical protein
LFAEVVSYDETTNTITVKPTTDSDNIEGVSLDAQGDKDKGFFAVPKVGSDVLIGFIDNEPYVKMYSELDLVVLKENLYSSLKGNETREQLYKLDNQLQAVITSLKNWTPVPNDGGAALKTYFAAQIAYNERADFNDVINENVKHG